MRQRSLSRRRRDRGASLIEYAGLIVLAALILGALVATGLPTKLGSGVGRALCTILHEQNCGKPPTTAAPPPGKPASPSTPAGTAPRFGGGILHGLASIVVPPAGERNALPIRAASLPTKPQKIPKPRRTGGGGDKTSGHNAVVRDAERLINQTKDQHVTDGKVTIDCAPGGTKANCIPGGHKSGNGKNGRADVILRGYDKDTGQPVIYIWEIKSDTTKGRAEAKVQLDQYVSLTQAQVGRSTDVRYGYDLDPNYSVFDKRGRRLEAYSLGSQEPDTQGVRLYRDPATASPTPPQQSAPQQTAQSQPQQRPSSLVCNEQPPIALKKECITLPGLPQQPPRGQPEQPQQQPQEQPKAPAEPEPIAPEPEPVPVEPLVPVP